MSSLVDVTRRVLLAGSLLIGVGCDRLDQPTQTPERATERDPEAHAFFDSDGDPSELDGFIASLADVDFVGFGELHHHSVGAQVQLAVLEGMAAQDRPVALAMEFFEADQQATLDAYLAGSIDEPTFREQTGRDDNYEQLHRPLIEFAKRSGIPVIAANAPRELVTAYRESGATYADYLATLSEGEQALMPRTSVPPDDEFKARFMKTMGERGPAFYPAMALWNDAMAESSADFRDAHPEHRILLIVGVYHVAKHLGVITQYRARRPDDSVRVVTMTPVEGPIVFDESNRGEGDLVLVVR
ncbi:ChaN family lipoprotein [Enhygromyxa salina]|uniref:Haem-binding uptake Tiki superfamily ChaN domain-containing protein n=1 Tax=Enhygromyxa salina TaxID=215803 RepID=A0A2S9Y855_9BACT|nr:ChaN family lipoprotein [Enhygromyxa salina]PRQ01201.1 hypothetical protein ENSA7_58060 [Enhygromyxa salina]